MKRFLAFIVILCLCQLSFCQPRALRGIVYDATGLYPVPEAQIHNLSSARYTFADENGAYKVNVSLHDTLVFSKAGFKQLMIVVDERDFSRLRKDVLLHAKAFILPTFYAVGLNATYEGFKKDVASAKLPESYKNLDDVHLTAEERRNAVYEEGEANVLKGTKVGSPITWIYDAFSKKQKMRRLYYEMESYGSEIDEVPAKYNKDLVSEITGLQEPELMEFMVYCRFSYYDLIRWSREKIIDRIRQKFDEYQYNKALQDEEDQ